MRLPSAWVLTIPILFACSPKESPEQAETSFARNVESCICRYLDVEEDNYSGLTYEFFIDDCNEIVHESNPARYPETLHSAPEISDLRCQEYVQPWLDEVEESQNLQDNNRKLFDELTNEEPAETQEAEEE